jgi:hypothetical protein
MCNVNVNMATFKMNQTTVFFIHQYIHKGSSTLFLLLFMNTFLTLNIKQDQSIFCPPIDAENETNIHVLTLLSVIDPNSRNVLSIYSSEPVEKCQSIALFLQSNVVSWVDRFILSLINIIDFFKQPKLRCFYVKQC